jgi:protein O-mannosyl-transferase
VKEDPSADIYRRFTLLVCLILILAVFTVYGPSLYYGFGPLDDDEYVTANPQVLAGLTLNGLTWAFSFHGAGYWHPLTWLSHMFDCELFGLNPLGHHLTNLLLHTANVLILFLVLMRLTGSLWKSAAVAALFALHPLNVESVVWVASRKNLLSTLFWMLTIWTYLRYVDRPRYSAYLAVLLCLALGLMAKPMLVTLPLVLLLFDYWPLGRLHSFSTTRDPLMEAPVAVSRRTAPSVTFVLLEKLPLLALSGASVVVSFLSAQSRNILVSGESVPVPLRVENALVSYVTYLFKMIWPNDLALFYPYPDAIPGWQWAGAGLLLAVGTGMVLWKARPAPFLPVGWFWYLITLLPVIGLVQQGLWPAWSDRFAYVPLIGPYIMVSWGIPVFLPRTVVTRRLLAFLFLLLILVFGLSSRQQVHIWGDNEDLLRNAIAAAPKNHLAHFNLACLLLSKGKMDEAITEYSEALRILPNTPLFQNGLGTALLGRGRIAEAVLHLKTAVRLAPNSVEALTNLGSALRQQGEWDEALDTLQKALKLKPVPEAYHNLGLLFAAKGRFQEAIPHYEQALHLRPSDGRIHNDLAAALYSLGQTEKAMYHISEAMRLSPGNPEVVQNFYFLTKELEHLDRKADPGRRP